MGLETVSPAAKKAEVAPKKSVAAKKNAGPAPKKRGLSATAQWALLGIVGLAILGVFVLRPAITDAGADLDAGIVTAEAFDLPELTDEGDRIRLADFEGTPAVVNFFASWCFQCEEELPAFRNVSRELGDDVDFIYVNSNETGDWRPMAQRRSFFEASGPRDGPQASKIATLSFFEASGRRDGPDTSKIGSDSSP